MTACPGTQTKLSVSVALASYNGERYLREQLDSISRQTRLPDELVISDDASVDATHEIIENFARQAPFPVRLLKNRERLGSTRNFEVAIRACSGDVIFLCDQDDVWYPPKIALMEERFISNPAAGAVFTDGDVVDQNLRQIARMWDVFGFTPKEQMKMASGDALDVLLRHPVVTGAALAFRATYRELVLPLPDLPNTWHDEWIALLIGATSNLALLPSPLIAYRQHDSNQVGLRRPGKNRGKTHPQRFGPRVIRFEAARTRLLEHAYYYPTDRRIIHRLDEVLSFLRVRSALPRSRLRRLPHILQELGTLRYHRFAYGLKSFHADIFS